MTGLCTDYVTGDPLVRLIQRSSKRQAELRARGEAIENGDLEELAKLRQGVSRHIRDVNHVRPTLWRWATLTGKNPWRLWGHQAGKAHGPDSQ